jgi:HEAT repeat protein
MSRTRKLAFIGLAVVVVAAIAAAILDPSRRLIGWVKGEPLYHGRAASAWARDLREPDSPESAEAMQTLVAGKAEAAPTCAWVLRNAPEPEARSRAGDVLAKMGKEAAPAKADMVAALSDSDSLVRAVATRAIGELAPDVPGAVPALVKLFPDIEAIRAVAKFGPAGSDAVPALTALLTHENPTVRWQAIRTLGKIREPSLPTLPDLMRLTLSDPDALVREHAAEAMGDIGPAAAAGVPALVKALKDPDPRVRRDAIRSLGQIGPAAKDALEDVRKATEDSDSNVRIAADRAVRLIDPAASKKK